jgi:hypothetical protein
MNIISANIPLTLILLTQWVLWRYQVRDGNQTKVPHTFMGYKADVTNSEHWTTFECAMKFAARPGFADGIGFVFTPQDLLCGIDLDNCYPHDAAECAPWAAGILERFGDTYSEVSPSGKGLKIWCLARAPRCGRWPIGDGAIEVYDRARFFTTTGRSSGVSVITDHQSDIEALVARLDGGRHHRAQARTIPEIIPQGRRHNTLVSLAGTMYRRGMTPEAIEAALEVTNQRQCDPPYAPEHVHKIIESMQRWGR